MSDKITIYKDGKTYYIPSSITGYNRMTGVEINGTIVMRTDNSDYFTSDEVKTLRLVTREEFPIAYTYDGHTIPIGEYNSRLETLKTYKEKIDETFDEDGKSRRVCIWSDKEKEKEYYILTNKYKCIHKPVITYGDWFDFEIVKLPKSTSKFIIPNWKVSDKLTLTCIFKVKDMTEEYVKELMVKYPQFKYSNYMSNYSWYIYINDTKYDAEKYMPNFPHVFKHGTYTECITFEKTIKAIIEGWFKLEDGKTKQKPIVNKTTLLNEITSITKMCQSIDSKQRTQNEKTRCFNALIALKKKLELEVSE